MSWPRTIGARLGLFNAGLVLLALIGLGGAGLVAVDRVLVAGAERILLDELLDVAKELEANRLDEEGILALLTREAAEEHVYDVHYRVSHPDGTPVASSGDRFWSRIAWHPFPGDSHRFDTVRVEDDPHRIRVGGRMLSTPEGPLQLDVALRLEPEDVAMARLLRAGALAVPAVIAVAAILGAFMARRALAPVDAIERAARTIGAGLRGKRLPASGTNDELDRLAATLNAMLDRLERAALRNLAFAGDVAHEVRTPLAVVRARLEEAQALVDDHGPGAALEQAHAAALRLDAMVRSLLALSRADEGASLSEPGPFDLGDVAREVVAFFAPAAEARGMELGLEVQGPVGLVGDRVAISRAVANLVDNALAYSPERSRIDVMVGVVDGRGSISVADRGPGVSEELRPRLFERFVRGEAALALRPEGAGLGLALVRAVARGAGGEVEHAPREGGGSVFSLRLPVLQEALAGG